MPHNIDDDDDELLGDEILGWRISRDKWKMRYLRLKKRCLVKARKKRKRKLKLKRGGWGRFLKR